METFFHAYAASKAKPPVLLDRNIQSRGVNDIRTLRCHNELSKVHVELKALQSLNKV